MSTPDPFANDPLFGNKATSDPFANDPLFSSPAGGVVAPVVPPVVSPPPAATPQLEAPDDPFANDPLLQELNGQRIQAEERYQKLRATGDTPELDRREPGFVSSLKAGTAGVIASVRVPALLMGESITEYFEQEFPDAAFTTFLREQTELERSYLGEAQATALAMPVSETFSALGAAEDYDTFVNTFMESDEKWTAIKELLGATVPFSAGMIAGTAAGGLPGTFGSVFLMDWGDSYHESLKAGKDKDTALQDATIKSLTQAGIDTSTMGIARVNLAGNKILDWIGQMGVQMIGGGGAEVLKHEFVDEDYTFGQVALEVAGEAFGGIPEILVARATAPGVTDERILAIKEDYEKLVKKADFEGAKRELSRLIPIIEERMAAATKDDIEVEGIDPETFGKIQLGAGDIRTTNIWAGLTQVINPDTGELEVLADHDWINDPVALTKETHNNTQIQDLELGIELLQQEIIEAQVIGDAAQVAELSTLLDVRRRDLAELQTRRGQEFDYALKAQTILRDWVEALAPDMKLVFSTDHAGKVLESVDPSFQGFNIKNSPNTFGHHWRMNDIAVLEVDLDNHIQADGSINEGKWVETLTHEFGHALFSHTWNQQTAQVKQALRKGWLRWAKDLLDNTNTVEEFYSKRYGPATAETFLENVPSFVKAIYQEGFDPRTQQFANQERRIYTWGFNEYVANQTTKALQSNEQIAGPVREFFDTIISKLKELFELVKGKYRTTETVEDFINLLAAKVAVEKLETAATLDRMSQETAIAEAKQVIGSVSKALGLKPPSKVPPEVRFPHEADNLEGGIDRYGFFSKWAMTLLQLADRNPHIAGLRKYTTNIRSWWRDKMRFIARADERLHEWRKLGDKRAAAVGAFMQDLTVLSYEDGKRFGPNDVEFRRLVDKHKLDQEQIDMVAKIEGDFGAVLDELYAVLLADVRKTQDAVERGKALDKLNRDFEGLRERNFFPLSRFGEYYLRVKAKQDMTYQGKTYAEGDVITFQMFEGGTLWSSFSMDTPPALKRVEQTFRDNALFDVSSGVVNDTQREFSGLPPQFLEMMRDRLDLNENQKKELDNLLRDIAPGRSFTKHMKTRKNVAGFSGDSLRAYADYFMHFANYVSRIKYKGDLQNNINEVVDSANIIAQRTGSAVKRGRIAQFMQQHFDYAMNPDNEWANLRSFGFLWYLGFVPKSAFVNLTQTVFVTQPFLASRFKESSATAALGRATKRLFDHYKRGKSNLREDEVRLINYLVETGIIEESMATELAAVAEGRALSRTATNTLFGSQKLGSALRTGAGYGAWLFQMAERANRYVTALAAYDLVLKEGVPIRDQKGKLTGEFRPATEREAFLFAQQAVEGTQFEYARFNRPRFMQGKKSIFFLFWQYMQNMLYFVGNDPGAARYILYMLAFAGLSGLPLAEDAMDIFDFLAKKLNKHFKDDSFLPVNIRKELRGFVAELGANPDLVMHGASRYSMGLPFLADAVGLPMPMVDVSGSISMGRIIPGIEALTRSDTEMRGDLGRAAEQAGGAVASIPLQLIYAIADDNPDSWRRWERAAPTIVQHMSKAMRYSIRGEATTPEGAVIKDFHVPEDRMDLAQVIAQGLGFADTEVNRLQEEHYMKKDILRYYEIRRRLYLEDLAYARRTQDQKHFALVMSDVRRFNRDLRRIGLANLALGPATIRRSLAERAKKRALIERGLPGGKRGVLIGRQVEEGFPEETTETLRQ